MDERPFSWRALFAVVYTASVSSVYFALGIVGRHAGGLTPVVFLAGGIFFQLSAMTYAEGVSLHSERGGSAVLARYAFNELVSFVAGWAIVLDYTILLAVTALTVPAYLSAFWGPLGHGAVEVIVAFAVIAYVAIDNIRGVGSGRLRRRIVVTFFDVGLQALIIVLGLALVFHPHRLTETIHLGHAPTWSSLLFAFPVGVIAFTGLEAAASIASEVRDRQRPDQTPRAVRLGRDRARVRRHRVRGHLRAARPPRGERPRPAPPEVADPRHRRGVPPALAGERAQVRRGGRRSRSG